MIAPLIAVLACLAGPSLSFPLDFLLASDLLNADYQDYFGPLSPDFYRKDFGLSWPLNRYGSWGDGVDPGNVGLDLLGKYYNPANPKSVDYARENFVRGDVFGSAEFGTRDEVTVRNNGYLRSPFYRYNSFNYPFNPYRRPLPYALRSLATPRLSPTDVPYFRR